MSDSISLFGEKWMKRFQKIEQESGSQANTLVAFAHTHAYVRTRTILRA